MALTQVIGSGIGQVTDIKIGGSGSANTLDDYEEGTWTPTLENYGGSPTIANPVYTKKIGRQVTIGVQITLDGTSDTSNFRILGLPFTSLDTGAGVFGAFRSYSNGDIGFSLIGANGTQINNYNSSGSNQNYNGAGAIGNDKDFRFVGTYFTA